MHLCCLKGCAQCLRLCHYYLPSQCRSSLAISLIGCRMCSSLLVALTCRLCACKRRLLLPLCFLASQCLVQSNKDLLVRL